MKLLKNTYISYSDNPNNQSIGVEMYLQDWSKQEPQLMLLTQTIVSYFANYPKMKI